MKVIVLMLAIISVELSLAAESINYEFNYILETVSVTNGENDGALTLGNIVLSADYEPQSISNTRFYGSLMAEHGGSPQAYVGDFQVTSNIDTGAVETILVYELYFESKFAQDKLKVLFGLFDVSGELNVNEPALFFVHSSPGTSAEFGSAGEMGPSIFPYPGVSLRLNYDLSERLYFAYVLSEGIPNQPNNPYGNQITLDSDEGNLQVFEFAYARAEKYKFGIGAWEFSEKFDDLTEVDGNGNPLQRKLAGQYVMADYHFHEYFYPFIRYGLSNTDVLEMKANLVVGFTGANPWRKTDTYGFMLSTAYLSDKYVDSLANGNNTEDAYEFSYAFALNDIFTFMPYGQWISTPAGDKDRDTAQVLGFRINTSYAF